MVIGYLISMRHDLSFSLEKVKKISLKKKPEKQRPFKPISLPGPPSLSLPFDIMMLISCPTDNMINSLMI